MWGYFPGSSTLLSLKALLIPCYNDSTLILYYFFIICSNRNNANLWIALRCACAVQRLARPYKQFLYVAGAPTICILLMCSGSNQFLRCVLSLPVPGPGRVWIWLASLDRWRSPTPAHCAWRRCPLAPSPPSLPSAPSPQCEDLGQSPLGGRLLLRFSCF
jgi:hypothetical protein